MNTQKTETASGKTAPPREETASHANPVRILIVDNQVIVRDGLKQILSVEFSKATFGEANNGDEAVEQIAKNQWDVVLLDITAPGRSGLDSLKQILNAKTAAAVLTLGRHPESQYAARVLRAGAAGYIMKNTASTDIIGAVKNVLAGDKYVSPALLETRAVVVSHELLSEREYQVMRFIALGKSVKEIGFELSLSVKTVSTYRTRIMEKMKLKSNSEIIRYAVHEGLVD